MILIPITLFTVVTLSKASTRVHSVHSSVLVHFSVRKYWYTVNSRHQKVPGQHQITKVKN